MQHNGTSLCSNLEVHLDTKYLYGMSGPILPIDVVYVGSLAVM